MTEQIDAENRSHLPNHLPPLSLAHLRECVTDIRAGNLPLRVGRRSLQAIEVMVANPSQAASKSIGDLASVLNVNASTLSRLARTLGYKSFSEFQGVFRRHVTNSGRRFSDRANRLNAKQYKTSSHLAMMAHIANEESKNISSMFKQLNEHSLERILYQLANSSQVRVYGSRHAYPLALMLTNALSLIQNNVSYLGASGDLGLGLSQLQSDDLLFLIDYRPYSRDALACAKLAQKRHIHCIVITDTPQSPLLNYASLSVITPTDGLYFGNNLAAPLVLVETLATLLAREQGADAVNMMMKREDTYADLQFDV